MLRIIGVISWGNREKEKIFCYEHCFTDRHEKTLVNRKGRDNKLYNKIPKSKIKKKKVNSDK